MAISVTYPIEVDCSSGSRRHTPVDWRGRARWWVSSGISLREMASQRERFVRPAVIRRKKSPGGASAAMRTVLRRQPGAQLEFAPWSGGFRDGAELGRVHETIGRAPVGMVQRVERLAAKLCMQPLREGEGANQRDVQRLHAGPVDGVASQVTERVCGGSGEGIRIEPRRRRAGARAENRLPV